MLWLNAAELPVPGGCGSQDCNGDGFVSVDDFAASCADSNGTGFCDGQDLIRQYSDGVDDDGNGYVDDIAGWDFLDDDNPYDASSYSSAQPRPGRPRRRVRRRRLGGTACALLQVVPMRGHVRGTEQLHRLRCTAGQRLRGGGGRIGALFNSVRTARSARDRAFLAISPGPEHCRPQHPHVYDEAAGRARWLTQGSEDRSRVHRLLRPRHPAGMNARSDVVPQLGHHPVRGHAHIVMPAVTGSAATGQASGAAGLVKSGARQEGIELAPNEIKQLLTGTAFDVDQPDTAGLGVPDPAHPGWDQHFGYGLPDLGLALERIDEARSAPGADHLARVVRALNVNQREVVDIEARLPPPAAGYTYRLQWAPGSSRRGDLRGERPDPQPGSRGRSRADLNRSAG
jgi:hypothetical protein